VDGHLNSSSDLADLALAARAADLLGSPLQDHEAIWTSRCPHDAAFIAIEDVAKRWHKRDRVLVWECWKMLHRIQNTSGDEPVGCAAQLILWMVQNI
jgi:hypothetical protein